MIARVRRARLAVIVPRVIAARCGCGTLPSTTADWRRVSSFTDDVAERRAARAAALPLIPTTVIGSFPQPSWLVDHDLLVAKGVPRTRAADVWRIPPDELDEALDAATLLAIHDQVRAGIDIVTDGEIRRESYFNHFANALDGVDRDRLGEGRQPRRRPLARAAGRAARSAAARRSSWPRPSSCAAPPTGSPR